MQFTVLTLFPELLDAFFNHGMIQRGTDRGLIQTRAINIRDFSSDRHNTVDDRPYGGGSGMVMKPEPLKAAIEAARKGSGNAKVIMMTPQGRRFDQDKAFELATHSQGLVFVCGRYEGIDERIHAALVDDEISIGDYVMTGGELAAMVVIDAVARLIPGVLGCSRSPESESFIDNRLEYAQYTRPEVFDGVKVPEVLLSGNHEKIRQWRKRSAFERTFLKRPDLLFNGSLSEEEKQIARDWSGELLRLAQQ